MKEKALNKAKGGLNGRLFFACGWPFFSNGSNFFAYFV
jgi:hypothetical protein